MKGVLIKYQGYTMMSCENVTFMFQTFDRQGDDIPQISRKDGGSLLFYIQIKEIQTFYEKIKDRVKVIKGLERAFYGATEFSIQDLNGFILTFAENA